MLPGVKDRTNAHEKKGVVYKLKCKDCDVTYVGQTGQCLKTRIYRHMLALKNADVEHYPLVGHALQNNHSIQWDDIEILASESILTKRLLMESFLMTKENTPVNRQNGVTHSPILEWLLKGVKLKNPEKVSFDFRF